MEEKEKETQKDTCELEEKLRDLENQLEELKREKEELYDRYLRLYAEFDNFRKRTQRELERHKELANEGIIKEILLVVDNFERALSAYDESSDAQSFVEGIKLIYKQLKEVLKKFGVEEIEAEGKPFDPNLHEAIMQVEHDQEDVVVQEVQKGYKLKGKLIRPSKVVVGKKRTA